MEEEKITKDKLKGPNWGWWVRVGLVVLIVLVVLAGLYWGVRSFYRPGGDIAEEVNIEEYVNAACDTVHTDLLQAMVEAGKNNSAICGLDISGQRITELTFGISNMSELKVIRANSNVIKQLPAWLGTLNQLQVIDLRNNNVSLVPKTIADLKELKVLDVRDNSIADEEKTRIKELLPNVIVLD